MKINLASQRRIFLPDKPPVDIDGSPADSLDPSLLPAECDLRMCGPVASLCEELMLARATVEVRGTISVVGVGAGPPWWGSS